MKGVRQNRAGTCEPTSDWRWFQWYLLAASAGAAVFFSLEWSFDLFSSSYSANFLKATLQGLFIPIAVIVFSRRQERRALQNAPRRVGDEGRVEIRDVGGRLLHTVGEGDLRAVQLSGARLQRACLWGEHLEGADFRDADLTNAWLRAAVLRDADLRGANLRSANLIDADLRNADLRGADLSQVGLGYTELGGAVFDDTTRWPDGFRPERRGCIRADGAQPNLPLPARAAQHGTESLPRPATVRADAPLEQRNSRG